MTIPGKDKTEGVMDSSKSPEIRPTVGFLCFPSSILVGLCEESVWWTSTIKLSSDLSNSRVHDRGVGLRRSTGTDPRGGSRVGSALESKDGV